VKKQIRRIPGNSGGEDDKQERGGRRHPVGVDGFKSFSDLGNGWKDKHWIVYFRREAALEQKRGRNGAVKA